MGKIINPPDFEVFMNKMIFLAIALNFSAIFSAVAQAEVLPASCNLNNDDIAIVELQSYEEFDQSINKNARNCDMMTKCADEKYEYNVCADPNGNVYAGTTKILLSTYNAGPSK